MGWGQGRFAWGTYNSDAPQFDVTTSRSYRPFSSLFWNRIRKALPTSLKSGPLLKSFNI